MKLQITYTINLKLMKEILSLSNYTQRITIGTFFEHVQVRLSAVGFMS